MNGKMPPYRRRPSPTIVKIVDRRLLKDYTLPDGTPTQVWREWGVCSEGKNWKWIHEFQQRQFLREFRYGYFRHRLEW